jgi:hypothetical protein
MHKVVLDSSMLARLPKLADHLELCDSSGKTLGHFLPAELYKEFLLAWADANITEEELERRRREPRGRSLKEIWQGLGQQ